MSKSHTCGTNQIYIQLVQLENALKLGLIRKCCTIGSQQNKIDTRFFHGRERYARHVIIIPQYLIMLVRLFVRCRQWCFPFLTHSCYWYSWDLLQQSVLVLMQCVLPLIKFSMFLKIMRKKKNKHRKSLLLARSKNSIVQKN